jgi:hypothetical protein
VTGGRRAEAGELSGDRSDGAGPKGSADRRVIALPGPTSRDRPSRCAHCGRQRAPAKRRLWMSEARGGGVRQGASDGAPDRPSGREARLPILRGVQAPCLREPRLDSSPRPVTTRVEPAHLTGRASGSVRPSPAGRARNGKRRVSSTWAGLRRTTGWRRTWLGPVPRAAPNVEWVLEEARCRPSRTTRTRRRRGR